MKSRSIFKALALTLAIALCVGVMPTISFAAEEVANGTTGSLTWVLDSDGVFTISGTGNMGTISTTTPNRNATTTVVIEEGATSIQGYAFSSFNNLETVYIPHSIATMGNSPFNGLTGLEIYYNGTEEEWNSISGISNGNIESSGTIHFNSNPGGGSGGGSGSGSSDPSENEISTSGSTGTSVVTVTAEATTFKVTVPTALAINVSATGAVTCATVAAITNESYGPVKVTGLSISAVTGEGKPNYTIVAYDHNMTTEQVDAKKIGIQLNGETTTDAGSITFAQTWNQIDGNGGTQAITYDANVSASSAAVETCNVANIVFTVSWAS